MTVELTQTSKEFFVMLAKDAPNWNDQPMIDNATREEKGTITDLKKKGLIAVVGTEKTPENIATFVGFTQDGVDLAVELGFPGISVHA